MGKTARDDESLPRTFHFFQFAIFNFQFRARYQFASHLVIVRGMNRRSIVVGIAVWVLSITALHLALNVNWTVLLNERRPLDQRKLNVAYIPVT